MWRDPVGMVLENTPGDAARAIANPRENGYMNVIEVVEADTETAAIDLPDKLHPILRE